MGRIWRGNIPLIIRWLGPSACVLVLLAVIGCQQSNFEEADELRLTAWQLYQEGQFDRAEGEALKSLQLVEAEFGMDHPTRASVLNVLAKIYDKQFRHAEAESLFLIAVDIDEKWPNTRKSNFATILYNLGEHYKAGQEPRKAVPYLIRSLDLREEAFGPVHRLVAMSTGALARAYYSLGELDSALSLLERTLKINQETLPSNHINITSTLQTLGAVLIKKGELDSGEVLLQRALSRDIETYGVNHANTANCYYKLGFLFVTRRNIQRGEEALRTGLDIMIEAAPEDTAAIIAFLLGLSTCRINQSRFEDADSLLIEALSHATAKFGENHPVLINILMLLGDLQKDRGQHEDAEAVWRKIVFLLLRHEPSSERPTSALHILGEMCYLNGHLEAADSCFEQAISRLEVSDEPDNEKLARWMREYAALLLELNHSEKALAYQKRAEYILQGQQ